MRARVLASALLAALLAMTLTGCGPTGPANLTEADDGTTVKLRAQQELIVTLPSNPTTGYKWDIDGSLPEPLTGGDSTYEADPGGADRVGAGGTQTFDFQAASDGSGTLKLKYWRSFEPTAAPEDTFEVRVEVGQ